MYYLIKEFAAKYSKKINEVLYMILDTSLPFLWHSLHNGYRIKPKAIPSTILYVNGINIIVTKLGNNSLKSLKSIFFKFWLIRHPIIIRIGANATSGIREINGIKNIDNKNSKPVNILTNPVFPPAVIPAVPSTVDTAGLVPLSEHIIVENEVHINALLVLSGALSKSET
jgi:hypothetical protein